MHPKRRSLLLLIFALSSAILLLYSSRHLSSTQLHTLPNPSTISIPTFSFTIKLLTFDRLASLRRCLHSLAAADYSGDRADIHIFVDHLPVNASGLVERNLEESHQILEFIDGFEWRHGQKLVHYRTGNAGLQAQWLEAWWPGSDDEFAFVVEDDLEVSLLYYKFLKDLILKYYYDRSNYSPLIYGASLQRPRFVAGKHGNKLKVDGDTHLFLYQIVGTWGQLLFPKPWKEFRLWYDIHKAKGIKPILQGMVTTGWYKKMGERIWTPWFIKFIYSKGYYNIYTNFLNERALSVSHRDAGVSYGKSVGPDSNLLQESSLDFKLWEMQPLRNLKWYDFCFREVHPGRIVRNLDELGSVLESMQKQTTVTLISLYQTTEKVARNLLCHLERLDVLNSIFIGNDSEFLLDLSRRGYLVIDSDQFVSSVRDQSLMSHKSSKTRTINEILVKASVLDKLSESGYSVWLIDGNIIPVSNSFYELPDPSCDIMAANSVEVMFLKSSSSRILGADFVSKVAEAGISLISSSYAPAEQKHLAWIVTKALESKANVRIQRLDDDMLGLKLSSTTVDGAYSETSKKWVFWSLSLDIDSIQRCLQDINMWLIDEDLSCTAVICHGK
ncbi:putative nucleotide-diphospho-sugar transferase [Dioscorea sansibarensis]